MSPEVTAANADTPEFQQRPAALCLYHANCMDGLIAAAVTHLYFKGNVECVAVSYKDDVPVELIKDRHVYLVDFTFEPEEILPHIDTMRSLTIIDHHKDAMGPWVAAYSDEATRHAKLTVYFDIQRSGAGLAWRFFFGGQGYGNRSTDMPILIQYAQEYDLWTKTLPNVDEVQSGLRYSFPPREAALAALSDFLVNSGPEDVEKLAEIGTVILRQEMIQVEAFIKRHLMVQTFMEFENVPVCHMPAELANQAGELLYTTYPDAPFVVLFEDNYKHGTRKYSFRSKKGSGMDVSAIAMRFGGKGHENSSGALVKHDLIFAPLAIIGVDLKAA